MPDISIRHRQGHFCLEAEFSLGVRWTVVFGPSGAGKSTLLRTIAGLVTPDFGRIQLNGRTLLDTATGLCVPAGRRSLGFVTQQPGLFPHLSVRGNVGFGLRHWRQEMRAARVAEMLHLFGAETLADQLVLQLSGGERQRVALARALAPRPDVLLLDEPLTGLDDASAHDILSRLLSLDVRVLYVSHDIGEIWRMPAEVVFLDSGHVTSVGPLQQVLAGHRERLLERLQSQVSSVI
jgi:molybdate transport system ATP-binding protein